MNKTTPSIEQGGRRLADVRDRQYEAAPDVWNSEARAALTAALNGPDGQFGMDDVTLTVHQAICEDSPEDCTEWGGQCVKAIDAIRAAILGSDQ